MADIGFNPVALRHDRVVGGVATETGIKFGDVVIMDVASTNQFRAVKCTTTAGDKPVRGVCVSQTDPTIGSSVGDNLEICDVGQPEVWLATSQTIVKGDRLVTSTEAGRVKKLAAETGGDIVGVAAQDAVSTGSPIRIAVTLHAPFERI